MNQRQWSRRPITDAEVPHLEALGQRVRSLRLVAGLTQRRLALLAELSAPGLGKLERGERRTRASTLRRIASALEPGSHEALLGELVRLAGPALAPESEYAERVARRRRRRAREREVAEMREEWLQERRAHLAQYGWTSLSWASFARSRAVDGLARAEDGASPDEMVEIIDSIRGALDNLGGTEQ